MQGFAVTASLVYKLSKFVFKTERKVISCYKKQKIIKIDKMFHPFLASYVYSLPCIKFIYSFH